MNIMGTVAEYVKEAKFVDFPDEVIEQAKRCVLDSIGCALGGYQTGIGKTHVALAKDLEGRPESTIIGDGTKVSSVSAAYTNTQLLEVLDNDDTYNFAPLHASPGVLPPALAVGEARKVSGEELLTAVVIGYEVLLRVARAVGTSRRLYIPHIQLGIGFGAVASACRLLGLSQGRIVNAFGILGSTIPGTPRRKRELRASGVGATIKSNRGMYALQGVLAALQAEKGLTGKKDVLDGDAFWQAGGADGCRFEELTKGLGEVYRIMEMGFKPTPSCRDTHPPMTAVWEVLEGWAVEPEEIEEIRLKGVLRLMSYEWETMIEAQFSAPCALAMALIGREPPGPRWYTTGRFKDPDIREFAKRVRFEWDPEADEIWTERGRMICTATVTTKDGRSRTAQIEHAKGEPENAMTKLELRDKFRANSASVIGEGQTEEVLELIEGLEALENVSVLMKLVGGKRARQAQLGGRSFS